jgi:SEC-C motif-containing protein
MTLIIGLANSQQVILISDRRLSSNGRVVEDESNKASVLICRDARLAVAFAGLAQAGTFLTRRWLLEALLKSAEPDHLMWPTISRFRDRATREFATITAVRKQDKRLSVVLAGYCYDEGLPRCYYFLISNFEGFDSQQPPLAVPLEEFRVHWGRESRPLEESLSVVITVGADKAITQEHVEMLQALLRENRPPKALVGKGVEIIHDVAESHRSGNLVGKQCTSIILPSDPEATASVGYHSSKVTHKIYGPSVVEARGGDFGSFILESPELEARDSLGRPSILNFPKVGRNHPCPCGSGIKYKKCHGRPEDNGPPVVIGSGDSQGQAGGRAAEAPRRLTPQSDRSPANSAASSRKGS